MSSLFGIGGGGNVGASGSFYDYSIDQSLRFNKPDNAHLSKTYGTAGNRKTFTISCWVKRSNLSAVNIGHICASYDGSSTRQFRILFNASDQLQFGQGGSGSSGIIATNAVFRDTSAWYHCVFVADYTNSTAADRAKIYVNGERQSVSTTTSFLDANGHWLSTYAMRIGRIGTSDAQYFGGYMSEFHCIDGTALDPTSFGETINGIWVPKEYSGSYGTNGFYLSFADSSAIGDDLSGNTNDWTANNLAASDVVPDSPTNNWATNNGAMRANITQSEGNLKMVGVGGNYDNMASTFTFDVEDADGWYWEYRSIGNNNDTTIGISTPQNAEFNQSDATNPFSNTTACVSYNGNGQKKIAGTNSSYGDSWTAGDIIGIAVKAGAVYFYKNGTIQNSGTAAATGLTGQYVAAYALNGTHSGTANYGQDSTFAGLETAGGNADTNGYGDFNSIPSGYKALCSANLPEPAIGPNSTTTSDENFNTVLYTGDGTNGQAITGVGHQPDLLWIKSRSGTAYHELHDSVRGAGTRLFSNDTAAESTVGTVSSFDSDGFTVSRNSAYDGTNQSGVSFVGWNWKAGGTAVSNTDGSITSSVSANPDAGFSIVSYTGTGANATVGHGLNGADMVIIKNRDAADNWAVGTIPGNNFANHLQLNSTAAASSAAAVFNDTNPTATVFSIGTNHKTNASGEDYIAYCFHSSDVCKVGKYVGNGNANGTFVYTGFRPAWIMTKRTDSTSNWLIIDVKRDIDNVSHHRLIANSSNAEATSVVATMDILSNGFKRRDTNTDVNASGGTYIYLAFAEAPFKYANAR